MTHNWSQHDGRDRVDANFSVANLGAEVTCVVGRHDMIRDFEVCSCARCNCITMSQLRCACGCAMCLHRPNCGETYRVCFDISPLHNQDEICQNVGAIKALKDSKKEIKGDAKLDLPQIQVLAAVTASKQNGMA